MAGDEKIFPPSENYENISEKEKKKKELEKQIRKRVACEERAFRIVERLVEVSVSLEQLKDMAHFLLPAHYKDITEERAIAKLCGFPVCKTILGKVKKQKYEISTKTNKVYDITEKKNFCSSKCFKSSKIFEKQILESPLWSRESEKPADFTLPDTKTGWMGVEVISQAVLFGDSTHLLEEEELSKSEDSSILDNRNWLNELQKDLEEKSPVFDKEPLQQAENQTRNDLDGEDVDPLSAAVVEEDENHGFDLSDVSDFLAGLQSQDAASDALERLSTGFDSDDDSDSNEETTEPPSSSSSPAPRHKKQPGCPQIDSLTDRLSKVDISRNQKTKPGSADSQVDYFKKLLSCQKQGLSTFIDHVVLTDKAEPLKPAVEENSNDEKPDLTSEASLAPPDSPSPKTLTVISAQQKIQNKIHSWVTQDSLHYLGISRPNHDGDPTREPGSVAVDPDFAKLSDRLDMKGLEFDELLEERLPQAMSNDKKRLPSYESLQQETENFGLKVKEYYKPTPKNIEKTNQEAVYILPPVDSVSQFRIRKSIVLQQLGKKLNDLLSPMNILIGEISTELNLLVSTFNLQKDTISFKPSEWSLIGIFMIFILSKKLKEVDIALQAEKVNDKYNKILHEFNLDFKQAQLIVQNEILIL